MIQRKGSGCDRCERKRTHSDPGRHKVDLVQHIHQMLVRLLLADVLDNGLTPGAHRISSVQNMDDDVGRVEHLVQLSPDTPRGTLGVHRFTHERSGRVVCLSTVSSHLALGGELCRGSRLTELLDRADVETGSFALGFRSEGVAERLGLDDVRTLTVSSCDVDAQPSSPCQQTLTRPRADPWAACSV